MKTRYTLTFALIQFLVAASALAVGPIDPGALTGTNQSPSTGTTIAKPSSLASAEQAGRVHPFETPSIVGTICEGLLSAGDFARIADGSQPLSTIDMDRLAWLQRYWTKTDARRNDAALNVGFEAESILFMVGMRGAANNEVGGVSYALRLLRRRTDVNRDYVVTVGSEASSYRYSRAEADIEVWLLKRLKGINAKATKL